MKKNNYIVFFSSSLILSSILSYSLGYFISKKKNTPKNSNGYIYIDYTEDPKHPGIYLNELNPDIFNIKNKYITLGLIHVRK